jgi:hypothetical protein
VYVIQEKIASAVQLTVYLGLQEGLNAETVYVKTVKHVSRAQAIVTAPERIFVATAADNHRVWTVVFLAETIGVEEKV